MLAIYISDVLYGSALFANAVLFLPQAWRVYKTKSTEGTSLITFAGFNIIQALGIINGIFNDDLALSIGQTVSFIACSAITAQVIFLRLKKHDK